MNVFELPASDPALIANWSPLLIANDGTKVVQTPFVASVTNTPGDPRTVGGGNDSVGGVEEIRGANPDLFEGQFYQIPQAVAKEISGWMCEELSVYLINEKNQIGGIIDDHDSPGEFRGIPIARKTFFIGSKGFGGFDNRDANAFRFQVIPEIMFDFHVISPTDFRPLDRLPTS
jgi:hypothetical protein